LLSAFIYLCCRLCVPSFPCHVFAASRDFSSTPLCTLPRSNPLTFRVTSFRTALRPLNTPPASLFRPASFRRRAHIPSQRILVRRLIQLSDPSLFSRCGGSFQPVSASEDFFFSFQSSCQAAIRSEKVTFSPPPLSAYPFRRSARVVCTFVSDLPGFFFPPLFFHAVLSHEDRRTHQSAPVGKQYVVDSFFLFIFHPLGFFLSPPTTTSVAIYGLRSPIFRLVFPIIICLIRDRRLYSSFAVFPPPGLPFLLSETGAIYCLSNSPAAHPPELSVLFFS